jgi:hypothetical protein
MWKLLYDYQTLLTGLIAIAAAYIAARPVWLQLKQGSVQTNAGLRDFLQDRIRITERMRKWFSDHLAPLSERINSEAYMQVESGAINPHWAFNEEQRTATKLDEVEFYWNGTGGPRSIETDVAATIDHLTHLRETLDAIHRPASADRDDPENPIDDDSWRTVLAAGAQAEQELLHVTGSLTNAVKRLDDALAAELKTLRDRLRQTDDLLLHAHL